MQVTCGSYEMEDNKVVTCIKNYNTCTRYSRDTKEKITVSQPKPVVNYNKYMGRVNIMNQGCHIVLEYLKMSGSGPFSPICFIVQFQTLGF